MSTRTRALAVQQMPARAGAQPRQIEYAGLTWLDLIQPTVAQVTTLRDRFGFDTLALEDVLSQIQRPKLDVYAENEYLFLVLHFPIFDKADRVASAGEVDIFVGPDYVVTAHDGRLKPLRRLFAAAATDERARAQLMGRGPGYLLYRIIDALIKACFPMLYRVDDHLARIEANLFGRNARAIARELAFARRDIIALRGILRPNLPVIRMLEAHQHTFLRLDQAVYMGDLADGLHKLWDLLAEQKEVVEGLNATLDSLLVHRINQALQIVMAIVAVLLPLILVANIFAMNVDLPLAQYPSAFAILILVMIGLAAGAVALLRYKDRI